MSPPLFLNPQDDVVYLHVKVQPRSSRNEIGEVVGEELKTKVTAPPVDSAVNEDLNKFPTQVLELSPPRPALVRARASRHKVMAVRAVGTAEMVHKLTPGNYD